MAYKVHSARGATVKAPTITSLYQLQSPEIAKILSELHDKFGKYALPDSELRRMTDKAMGNRTLSEELYAMREGR